MASGCLAEEPHPLSKDPEYCYTAHLKCDRYGGTDHMAFSCLWSAEHVIARNLERTPAPTNLTCNRCTKESHKAHDCEATFIVLHPAGINVTTLGTGAQAVHQQTP